MLDKKNIHKLFYNVDGNFDKISYENFINCNYLSFEDYIKSLAPYFSIYIKKNFIKTQYYDKSGIHEDIYSYLFNPLNKYYENLGKMHRPLLCILSYLACDNCNINNIENILPIAASIEHFQSAALIHDDIADFATLRRGKPCLHKILGDGLAINAGDYGLSVVVGNILSSKNQINYTNGKLLKIIDLLVKMEYTTIQGQAMDLGWSKDCRFDISESDYLTMATKKTAYYSAAVPCMLGAICSDCCEDVVKNLKEFGKKVGLAFQIRDDLLNIVENGSKLSKQKDFRSDITEGKRTLIVAKTLEMTDKKDKDIVLDILKSKCKDKEKQNLVVEIMQKCGAIDYSISYANKLCKDAVSYLDVLPSLKWKEILIDLSNWAINRTI